MYQAMHENGSKPEILPLYGSNTLTKGQPTDRVDFRPIVVGVVGGMSLTVILILIWLWRWRRRKAKSATMQLPKELAAHPSSQSSKISGPHEIHTSSIYSPIPEAYDTGKLELIDNHSPSGSGKHIHEMANASTSHVWEMATSITPQRKISREAITLREGPQRPLAVIVQRRTSWNSCTSFDTSIQSSVVETTISAMVSPLSPKRTHPRRESRRHRSINLNRPLPPLPQSTYEVEEDLNMF